MKRFFSLFLILCLIISMVPAVCAAETGTCGDGFVWTLDDEGTMTISGEGAMDLYNDPDDAPWYDRLDMNKIKKVIVEEGVTRIGSDAFSGQTSLTSVVIPSTVTFIADSAFYDCTALTDVTIAPGEETLSIGRYVFSGCSALEEITVPGNVGSIQVGAFSRCTSLTDVTLSEGVWNLDEYVFADCTALEEIRLPSTIYGIGTGAFQHCTALKNVIFPTNAFYIDNAAFIECSSLTEVVLPERIWRLGEDAFYLCTSLESLVILNPSMYVPNLENAVPTWTAFGHPSLTTVHVSPFSPLVKDLERLGFRLAEHTPGSDGTCTVCGSYTKMFDDVSEGAYYYDPVVWALTNSITAGTSSTTFSPDAPCTRAQVVTFLWRSAGEPAPENQENPFTDVSESDYYYNAVLWAVENGITQGTSAATFGPGEPCTRAQVATFLWRYSACPSTGSANPFRDVPADAYYHTPVLWAVSTGLTQGTSAATFSPNDTCTRAQIVTFLYRLEGIPKG